MLSNAKLNMLLVGLTLYVNLPVYGPGLVVLQEYVTPTWNIMIIKIKLVLLEFKIYNAKKDAILEDNQLGIPTLIIYIKIMLNVSIIAMKF